LRAAAERYRIPLAQWLDLSTGINPVSCPMPSLSEADWRNLPDADDELCRAAQAYYGAPALLPVAGSQAAIQALPLLRGHSRVGFIAPSYAEHQQAWQRAGHQCHIIAFENPNLDLASQPIDLKKPSLDLENSSAAAAAIEAALATLDVLVLINPNNPTGQRFSAAQLLRWHSVLAAKGGWLVVDEAFMDCTPADSLAAWTHLKGLIVLRSLGKFFGLAGARVGFVLAESSLLKALNEWLGPWTISGPAQRVAEYALRQQAWQTTQRQHLPQASQQLAAVLHQHGLPVHGQTALFCYCQTPQAAQLHQQFAERGMLTRLFDQPSALRFGLPHYPQDWDKLVVALGEIKKG
jgi:L-threonine-O-3-phosphate decarboxylase